VGPCIAWTLISCDGFRQTINQIDMEAGMRPAKVSTGQAHIDYLFNRRRRLSVLGMKGDDDTAGNRREPNQNAWATDQVSCCETGFRA